MHPGATLEGDRRIADISTMSTVRGRFDRERRETRRGSQIAHPRGTAEGLLVVSPKPLVAAAYTHALQG